MSFNIFRERLAKVIRVITIPPIAALVMIILLRGELTLISAVRAAFFLCVLPVLAYPVWWAVPKLKKGGRDSQRKLAVIFSVVGYVAGTVWCLTSGGGKTELIIFLSYLISGVLIALFSYVFKMKGSGHAAGLAGPVTMLSYFLGPWFLSGYLLLAAVFWSSVRTGRHTLSQMFLGSMFPITAIALLSILLR